MDTQTYWVVLGLLRLSSSGRIDESSRVSSGSSVLDMVSAGKMVLEAGVVHARSGAPAFVYRQVDQALQQYVSTILGWI